MVDELNPEDVTGEVPPIAGEETPPAETPPAESPPVDQPPDPAALQAEITALEEKRKKAEQDAIYWRRQKAEARKDYFKQPETPPAGQPQPAEAGEPKRPAQEDFDDYNDYVDALTDYKTDVKIQQWRRDEEQKAQSATAQAKEAKLQEGINKGYEKYEDFEDIAMDPAVPITPMITEILAESDMPADIAYYLGKNRPEAVKISRMTPIAAAREIARIEAKLSDESPHGPTPTKKTTTAPPPINPVGSSSTGPAKPLEEMSQKEYEAEMDRRGARRF